MEVMGSVAMEYFCCYHSYLKKCEKLTDQELGRLFRALLAYSGTGQRQELAGRESIAFDFIADDIDRARAAYESKCQANAKNGKQGGRTKKPPLSEKANGSEKSERFPKKRTVFEESEKSQNKNKEEDKDEKEKEEENPPKPPEGPPASSPERFPYEQYRQAFVEACPSLPVPQEASRWTDARKRALRRVGMSVEQFRELCERAEQSDFLTGRDGKWAGCSLDWLLKPANWGKLMEGNYDNRRGQPRNSSYDIDEMERFASLLIPENL